MRILDQMAPRTIDLEGVRLGLRCWGDEHDDAPLLLLHSLGEESSSWEPIAEELATTHRVVALDLRGHGDSDRAPSYSLELMRDDIRAVMDRLDLRDVCIIGHSLGGMVGYLVAMSGGTRLTRLVLEEAPPPLPSIPAREPPPAPEGDPGFDWKAVADLYAQRNNPGPTWWNELEQIEIPVLVVAGGPSSHIDQPKTQEMATRMPKARYVSIDAGHDVHTRKPREFVAVIEDFLSTGTTTTR